MGFTPSPDKAKFGRQELMELVPVIAGRPLKKTVTERKEGKTKIPLWLNF
jgi:hypothetical protein